MKNATANIGKKAIRLFVLEEPQVGRRRVVIQCVPNSFTPLKHKGQPDGKLKSCFLSFDIYSEFLLQLPSSRNAKSIIGFGEASNLLNGRRLLTVFELEESRRRDDSCLVLKKTRACVCVVSRHVVVSLSLLFPPLLCGRFLSHHSFTSVFFHSPSLPASLGSCFSS